jgi:general L-amino acid transport system permease protein
MNSEKSERSLRVKVIDPLICLGFLGLLCFFFFELKEQLDLKSIKWGFGFLKQEAGFPISESLPLPEWILQLQGSWNWISYDSAHTFLGALVTGLMNTLKVGVLSCFFAIGLGFLMAGLGFLYPKYIKWILSEWIANVRSVPLLVHLVVWYVMLINVLPSVSQSWVLGECLFLNRRGLFLPWVEQMFPLQLDFPRLIFGGRNLEGGMTVSPELVAMVLGLGTYSSVFASEILRSGLEGVAKGQLEAGFSLHLDPFQILRYVVFPQALRFAVGPMASLIGSILKNSSLGIVIGYPDLIHVGGTVINQTGQALEVVFLWLVVFLVLNSCITIFFRLFQQRFLGGKPQ